MKSSAKGGVRNSSAHTIRTFLDLKHAFWLLLSPAINVSIVCFFNELRDYHCNFLLCSHIVSIVVRKADYKVHKIRTFLDYKHVKALHLAPAVSSSIFLHRLRGHCVC